MRKLLALPITLPLSALRGAVSGAVDAVTSALDGRPEDPLPPPSPPRPARPPRAAEPPRPPAPPAPPKDEVLEVLPEPPEAEVVTATATAEEIADELGFVDAHLDEPEPELVESEGAADPGGTLRVGEPWPGYAKLRAPEIVDRLAAADAATKAVVRLYETANRGRRTVLAATDG